MNLWGAAEGAKSPPRARRPSSSGCHDASGIDVEDLGASGEAFNSRQRLAGLPAANAGVRQRHHGLRSRSDAADLAARGLRSSNGGTQAVSREKGPSAVPRRTPLEAQLGVEVWESAGERKAYLYNITQMTMQVNSSKEKKELFSGQLQY